ncbi:MAG TPA: hypothetical protein VE521_04525 [Nitrososphaera sp.]|jgi:hypothetical protein|nr:hypothetical protein [Nitrososphaera sp.]
MIYDQAENKLYFTAGIKNILKKYNVDVEKAYQSIENFASICNFQPTRKKIRSTDIAQTRAAWVDMQQLVRTLTMNEFKGLNERMSTVSEAS